MMQKDLFFLNQEVKDSSVLKNNSNNHFSPTKQKQESKSNKSNKVKATKQKLKLWASAFAYDAKGLVSF